MKSEEYKRVTKKGKVLEFLTLNSTKEQLDKLGNQRLALQIERILQENKVEKPTLHNRAEDKTTDHYRVDLRSEDIETIVNTFSDLEVGELGLVYDSTQSSAFYAYLLDAWNNLLDYK